MTIPVDKSDGTLRDGWKQQEPDKLKNPTPTQNEEEFSDTPEPREKEHHPTTTRPSGEQQLFKAESEIQEVIDELIEEEKEEDIIIDNEPEESQKIKCYREPEGDWIEPAEGTWFELSCYGEYILICNVEGVEVSRVNCQFVREIEWEVK